MDKLKPCPNCENLKHPDFPCIRCYPLNPVFVRRPASNTNTDTALAAAEAKLAYFEELAGERLVQISDDADRIAALEKALEPFALTGKMIPTDFSDFEVMTIYASAQHLRRAAALLKEKE